MHCTHHYPDIETKRGYKKRQRKQKQEEKELRGRREEKKRGWGEKGRNYMLV